MTPTPDPDSDVERVPLEQGDPAWVFPTITDAEAETVRTTFAEADARLRELGNHLGMRAALHYTRLPFPEPTPASIHGVVELPNGVTIVAALYCPRRCGFDLRWGPPWVIDADIVRYCPAPADCGGHPVADTDTVCDTPPAAARALVEVTGWLREQALARTRAQWLAPAPTPDCAPFERPVPPVADTGDGAAGVTGAAGPPGRG